MPNRLAGETSPYLRQHADNPVDWWPWSGDAFDLARRTDRPVLLSVGYSSCHWCHVMAHESFEDPAVAARMNEWFVPVKVDREERPDVDAVYMEATQAMTGHGGWPMTVFTDADGRPFFCGTYFPPEPRHGRISFPQLLAAVHDAWTNRRGDLAEQAERLTESLRRPIGASAVGPGAPTTFVGAAGTALLDEAAMGMLAAHDSEWGGFGHAPKFPQGMSLDHLLRHHHRTGSRSALTAVVGSLDAMAAGGIHDQLGGGFSRYSVDRRWLVPHFEKMLYDNALLARLYLHAHQVTGEPRFLDVVTSTVEYVLRDLSHPDGGRYSAEDADSRPQDAPADAHAEEGAFYLWSPAQVAAALADAGLAEHTDAVCEWFDITPSGNFEGASIPNRLHAAAPGSGPAQERPPWFDGVRSALLAARGRRPRPGLDDKVLTEWNALFVAALAEAAAVTDDAGWAAEAERTADFLLAALRREDGRWLRSWQAAPSDHGSRSVGRAQHLAYAADLGALLDAFLCLHETTGRRRWLDEAVEVAGQLEDLFVDTSGGAGHGTVFATGADAEALLVRPREVMDNPTPSGASLAAVGFLRLGALTGDERWTLTAEAIVDSLAGLVEGHPLGFGHLLWALQIAAGGATEVVVTGERPDLVRTVQHAFRPTVVLSWGEPGEGPLWEERGESGADGRAYVCRDRTCEAPITDPAALVEALRA